jgi:hypothetical protein
MIKEKRLKEESLARKLSDIFQLSGREALYIVFLAALLTFLSLFSFLNIEYNELPPTATAHYGFPFESLKHIFTFRNGTMVSHGYIEPITIMDMTIETIWLGLVVDFVVYALLFMVIVKVIVKVNEEIYFRKYD